MRQLAFRSYAQPVVRSAANGFEAVQQIGFFEAEDQAVRGGLASITSPWGETLIARYWVANDVFSIDLGRGILIAYVFDQYGRLDGIYAEADGETTFSDMRGMEGWRLRRQAYWAASDLDAVLAVGRALASEYSAGFLEGLAALKAESEVSLASCTTQGLLCTIYIFGYLAQWAGVAVCVSSAGLGPGVILAAGCLSWILQHLTVSAVAMATCADYHQDCVVTGGPQEEPTPEVIPVDPGSPIILDLNGNGYHLSGPNPPVAFDLQPDGEVELWSWTAAADPDSFLCLDDNQNGTIDNGTELFGNYTILSSGEWAENGFEALGEFDQPEFGGNGDGSISPDDSVFSMLRVWTDSNRDGLSQASELQDLSSAGVVSIECAYEESGRRDSYGNEFRFKGRAKVLNPAANVKTIPIYDVFFVHP